MSTLDTIIFDLGGVVFNWQPSVIATHYFSEPTKQQDFLNHMVHHEDWQELDRGTLSIPQASKRAASRCSISALEFTALFQNLGTQLPPMLDTIEIMEALYKNNYSLYCLSNMQTQVISYLRRKYPGVFQKFKQMVFSCHINLVKPEPEIYHYILEQCHLDADRCVFIDDSQPNIEAAQKLGITGLLFQSAKQCQEALQDLGFTLESKN